MDTKELIVSQRSLNVWDEGWQERESLIPGSVIHRTSDLNPQKLRVNFSIKEILNSKELDKLYIK
jgi:hypothetical protein